MVAPWDAQKRTENTIERNSLITNDFQDKHDKDDNAVENNNSVPGGEAKFCGFSENVFFTHESMIILCKLSSSAPAMQIRSDKGGNKIATRMRHMVFYRQRVE